MTKIEIGDIFAIYFPDKNIVAMCESIVWADGHHERQWLDKEYFLGEDFKAEYDDEEIGDVLMPQRLLYLIVEKAKKDKFPLEDWLLFEIPYSDTNGQIWGFVNKNEYHRYHRLGQKDTCIHSLDFYVSYDGHVTPSAIGDCGNGRYTIDKDNCFDAVYHLEE